jgi:serine/threonine-protein kinase
VPSGWRLAALVSGLCWLGTLGASLGWTLLVSGITDPFYWTKFANLQFFTMANAAIAVTGAGLVHRLRRREIEARSRGRYKMMGAIGAGGFGEVWKAWDHLLERSCAIKMLDPKYGAQEEYIARFELEAKATCRLTSPHTVRIYDYGCTREQRLYYVMEYLKGRDLASVQAEEGRLRPERVVPLMRQAASALIEAHEQGVVHRDIKPENLFVTLDETGDEQLKVLDFGLAAALTDDGGDAPKERLVGTPEYMAPERARGQRGDARSDVYALGAVMFRLLTGHVPFDGETPMAILVKQVREAPRRPSELATDVPEFLDAIVLKCLEKDPDKRFADMRALRKTLATAEVILLRERPRRVA